MENTGIVRKVNRFSCLTNKKKIIFREKEIEFPYSHIEFQFDSQTLREGFKDISWDDINSIHILTSEGNNIEILLQREQAGKDI